jgi:hypothetical protein
MTQGVEHRPTPELRLTVERMIACGEAQNTVARSLCIDDDTLRKHYSDEIAFGWANRRKEIVELLFESARKGNISAQKRLEEITRAVGAAESVNSRGEKPAKEVALGKKEQRQAAAENIGDGESKFAPPEPPKLVHSR